MSRTGVGKAIYSILGADATVTGLLGSGNALRVYPIQAPQNAALPFVVYTKVANDPQDTKDGQAVDHIRIQIDVYASTYSNLEDVSAAVDGALNLYRGTANGVVVDEIRYETENDTVEEDETFYRNSVDYLVRIKL
jgi:hypothetical protein